MITHRQQPFQRALTDIAHAPRRPAVLLNAVRCGEVDRRVIGKPGQRLVDPADLRLPLELQPRRRESLASFDPFFEPGKAACQLAQAAHNLPAPPLRGPTDRHEVRQLTRLAVVEKHLIAADRLG